VAPGGGPAAAADGDEPPVVVVDETLLPRLADELGHRGYRAAAVGALGLRGRPDAELLATLHERLGSAFVLLTYDPALIVEHRAALRSRGTSVAVIRPRPRRDARTVAHWQHEVAHRWAHLYARRAAATGRVLTLRGARRVRL
jgi:hypothetical protein